MAQPKTRATRPVTDKVRAALFDIIGPVTGFTVLDAYAGSGAVGFEAASRGAALVESIESNARVARTIQSNVSALHLEDAYVLNIIPVQTWLAAPAQNPPTARYNLIIVDPPYAQLDADVLERLAAFLLPSGILVVSHSSKLPPPQLTAASHVTSKTYGDSSLGFFRR